MMIGFANLKSCLVRRLGFAAAAVLMLAISPGKPANAMSPISAGAVPAVNNASQDLATEARFGGGGFHGGGGGFHGGGFHAGGAVFHAGGGGWHGGGGGWHGGGIRYGGLHYGGIGYGGYGFHHFHHRRFYGGGYYPYYDGGYYPYYHRCRIIWTYYGPHRVCHWPHVYGWHRWHHRYWHHRHWHHRHYW